MDNLVPLYTSFDGRIGRKSYWIGVIGIAIASVIISFILSLIGFAVIPNQALFDPATSTVDRAAVSETMNAAMRAAAWGSLIMFVILAIPSLAIAVKRRHDRANSGLDVYVFFALTLVMLLIQVSGFAYTTIDINGFLVPTPSVLMMILSGIVGVFSIYLLIVLGFLKGTEGPNAYGPDPVGAAATI